MIQRNYETVTLTIILDVILWVKSNLVVIQIFFIYRTTFSDLILVSLKFQGK